MEIEKFELHGGSQDGRVFEFIVPYRPLTFSMDGHERYCLRPDNMSFGLVAPDASLVIHKDEKDVRFGTLEVPDDGQLVPGDAFDAGNAGAPTQEYIAELRERITRLKQALAPFAQLQKRCLSDDYRSWWKTVNDDSECSLFEVWDVKITAGDIRNAAKAIEE